MTLEEYNFYSDIALKIFNYMNGKVNTVNRDCILIINMTDKLDGNLGFFDPPNHIHIYLENIIDRDDFRGNISITTTSLAWTIGHELAHADQLLDRLRYDIDDSYYNKIEEEVQCYSYKFLQHHKNELSRILGIPIVIDYLTASNLNESAVFNNIRLEDFYVQTIKNAVLSDKFNNTVFSINRNAYRNIVVIFSTDRDCFYDEFYMKFNGVYCDNASRFGNIVYEYCGKYDMFKICLSESELEDSNTLIMRFNVTDRFINPIKFQKDIGSS